MTNVFLSHKQACGDLAEALMVALNKVVPDVRIFHAEDIEKSDDYRVTINSALKDAKCFVLLYTDPALDWSWWPAPGSGDTALGVSWNGR